MSAVEVLAHHFPVFFRKSVGLHTAGQDCISFCLGQAYSDGLHGRGNYTPVLCIAPCRTLRVLRPLGRVRPLFTRSLWPRVVPARPESLCLIRLGQQCALFIGCQEEFNFPFQALKVTNLRCELCPPALQFLASYRVSSHK